MEYLKFRPAESLSPYVECYFVWESPGNAEQELIVESPPNNYCGLVINYGDPYFLQNKKYERLQAPLQFIAGLSVYSYQLSLKGKIGLAGIVFKPSALATLFGLNAYEFTEERLDLFTVLQQAYIKEYVSLIRQSNSADHRAKLLEDFLLHHIAIHKPEPDYIDTAVNIIVEKKGMLHVNDLLKDSCMSRRTFERKFFQKVGFSPKYFARLRRFSYLCNLISGKKKVNWPDVFLQLEYYDQSHFIKDFEEFTGRSPQQYLRENTELANFLEKPVIQSIP